MAGSKGFPSQEGGRPFPASLSWLLDNPFSRAQADRLVRKLNVQPGMKVLDLRSRSISCPRSNCDVE
jgi:hypothetical protein